MLNFNIIFHSIIKRWNADESKWERFFQVHLEFIRDGQYEVEKSHVFTLTPEETHTVKAFSKAIWYEEFLIVNFNTDYQIQQFFAHLNNKVYKPQIVTEYDHYGFIRHQGRNYYIAENCLINIPQTHIEQLQCIAPNDKGAFRIGQSDFIALDSSVKPAPIIECGVVDEYTGRYLEFEDDIYSLIGDKRKRFKPLFRDIEESLKQMIGGKKYEEFGGEGTLILAFIFSFHFFDDIYKTYAHIIYLYLYGQANSGKGRMAHIILSFFGIPGTDSQTQPTIRALENAMSSHSKIPTWIDEFVPETPGARAKISDQLFNTWFELRNRPTSSGSNRRRNEEKVVRTMLMFCSNFVPIADHLNSRALKMEYAFHKRGEEEHYYKLYEKRAELQKLWIGFMAAYPDIDRKFFRKELVTMKSMVRKHAQKLIEQKKERLGGNYTLEDRQVESIAALVCTYHEIDGVHERIRYTSDMIDKETDDVIIDNLVNLLLEDRKSFIFEFGCQFLAKNAMRVGERDDLSTFLATIEYLVTEGVVTEKYYGWQGDDLKIWFEGLYAAYIDRVKANNVPKETVRGKISAISTRPEPHTQNWTDSFSSTHRKHGFRIKDAAKDHRFRFAFKHKNIHQPDDTGFTL